MNSIKVNAIQFNHDPNGCSHDALTIRRNFSTTVTVPEWKSGMVAPEESPAAYAVHETTGNRITIKVRFAIRPDPPLPPLTVRPKEVTLKIRAIPPARWINVLGSVQAKSITIRLDLRLKLPYIDFELENTQLGVFGIGIHTVKWNWQYQIESVKPGSLPKPQIVKWTTFDTTTHRIYTVLETPKAPWLQSPPAAGVTQLPWTEVLDFACAWAQGATTSEDAACRVTGQIYNLGPDTITYDCPGGGSSHYSWGKFACTKFIERLRGGTGNGIYVNCSDCATFVSEFANILGCDLWQSKMGWGFSLRPLLGIGSSVCETACGWGGFSYHEVAWTGACDAADRVYDACLLLDCAVTPASPVLACNMRFGNCGDGDYRDRLATAATCPSCAPQPGSRQRREVE